ncbi:MAG: hypothetical protein JWR37_2412, partial [Mycobacterium sp.]|nr:hypothetical protein [Mycobacterium sp.]
FSVVTISFNDLEGLKRTVESVRAQRYEGHVEHIVIDGGSGDKVVDYLSQSEPGFAYWQSEPDAGRYDAMNQGVAHASGDLVWFMHSSDCFSDPDALAQVAQRISGHGPARDLWGYAQVNRIGADGRSLGVWGTVPFEMSKFSMGRQPIPHQATFFGLSLLHKLGGYDLDFGIAADQLYIFRAAMLRDPVTLERVVCDFDTSGAGSVRALRENYRDLRKLWDLMDYYPLGHRRKSRAYLRYLEYRTRSLWAAFRAVKGVQARLKREDPT